MHPHQLSIQFNTGRKFMVTLTLITNIIISIKYIALCESIKYIELCECNCQ